MKISADESVKKKSYSEVKEFIKMKELL